MVHNNGEYGLYVAQLQDTFYLASQTVPQAVGIIRRSPTFYHLVDIIKFHQLAAGLGAGLFYRWRLGIFLIPGNVRAIHLVCYENLLQVKHFDYQLNGSILVRADVVLLFDRFGPI